MAKHVPHANDFKNWLNNAKRSLITDASKYRAQEKGKKKDN